MRPILITGGQGLIGTALRAALRAIEVPTVGLDLLGVDRDLGDVRDVHDVRRAIDGCAGVVHLAAVSRVIAGERSPDTCVQTNVGAVRNVLECVERHRDRPWVVFASSREVYGQAASLPATEDTVLAPINVYGRTKVDGEVMIAEACRRGVRTAVVRLSNVYGSARDHADRVVPAFARAAVLGGQLRVDGREHTFDFTHIDDTISALVALIEHLQRGGEALPPIHILTGRPTTLGELAALAVDLAGTNAAIIEGPPRTFDVSRFYGDPTRAREVLGWVPRVSVRDGLARLIADYRQELIVTRVASEAVT